jgi:hypothetical protein
VGCKNNFTAKDNSLKKGISFPVRVVVSISVNDIVINQQQASTVANQ